MEEWKTLRANSRAELSRENMDQSRRQSSKCVTTLAREQEQKENSDYNREAVFVSRQW